MFDRSALIELALPSNEGDKTIIMRQPTDEEWALSVGKRVTHFKDLGRGITAADVQGKKESDLALYNKIKQEESAELDEYEAALVMDSLAECKTVDLLKQGSSFEVTLRTCQGETKHVVKCPSHKQMAICREHSIKSHFGKFGVNLTRTNIRPSGELYDQLVERVEDYVVPEGQDFKKIVPLPHKYAVIEAIHADLNNIRNASNAEGVDIFS